MKLNLFSDGGPIEYGDAIRILPLHFSKGQRSREWIWLAVFGSCNNVKDRLIYCSSVSS